MSPLQRYIAHLHCPQSSAQLIVKQLTDLGITLDREYGLLPVNAAGDQLVGRVFVTEDAIQRAQETLPVAFFPDLGISQSSEFEE